MKTRIAWIIAGVVLGAFPSMADNITNLYFGQEVYVGMPLTTVAGGEAPPGECLVSIWSSNTLSAVLAPGSADASYYVGEILTNSCSGPLCRVSAPLKKQAGDISGINYVVQLFTMSGTSLDALLSTSEAVAGNNAWNYDWVEFSFASPYTLVEGNTYGLAITAQTVDAVNYIYATENADTVTNGYRGRWASAKGLVSGSGTKDWNFILFTTQ